MSWGVIGAVAQWRDRTSVVPLLRFNAAYRRTCRLVDIPSARTGTDCIHIIIFISYPILMSLKCIVLDDHRQDHPNLNKPI